MPVGPRTPRRVAGSVPVRGLLPSSRVLSACLSVWGGAKYSLDQMRSVLGFEADGLTADPLFTDPAAGDFSLQPASPAVDLGAELTGVTADLTGVPRPQGAYNDIGAYEYFTGTVPATRPMPPENLRVSTLAE